MKSTFRNSCCFFLVVSLLLQSAPMVLSQPCQGGGAMGGLVAELQEARRILSDESGSRGLQNAVSPLDNAKKIVNNRAFAKQFPREAPQLLRGIEKAKCEVVWDNKNNALGIVNRMLGMCDNQPKGQATAPDKGPVSQNPNGQNGQNNPTNPQNGPGLGAFFGGTLIAGLGAILVGLMFGLGQVSHR